MLLDPPSRAFLDAMFAAGGKPLYELSVDEAREVVRASSTQLAGPAADVHRVEDRSIGPAGAEFAIRLYWPRPLDADTRLPIVVCFHGGGFVAGDIDTYDATARYYCANADVIVVNVGYRRPPEHRFPAAVDDAYASVEWAAAHAREIHGDGGRIAVAGDSAGGTLAAVVCQLAKERRGPAIAYQVLVYPTVDVSPGSTYASRDQFGGGDYFLSTRDMDWFMSHYLGDVARHARDPRASPLLREDLSGLPPALIVAAGCDLLLDEGRAYADRLRAAGVPVEYRCFEQTIHAFMAFAAVIPAATEARSLVAARLRSSLHGT